MFTTELPHWRLRRKGKLQQALDHADIDDPAALTRPGESQAGQAAPQRPQLPDAACVLDFNQHFIELSNHVDASARGACVMEGIAGLLMVLMALLMGGLGVALLLTDHPALTHWDAVMLAALAMSAALVALLAGFAGCRAAGAGLFTALRCRYRFNRSTGKVHVLRPHACGGNAVLDWSSVAAHVQWAPPSTKAERDAEKALSDDVDDYNRRTHMGRDGDLSGALSLFLDALLSVVPTKIDTSPQARQARRASAAQHGQLLLYWATPNSVAGDGNGNGNGNGNGSGNSPELLWLGPVGGAAGH